MRRSVQTEKYNMPGDASIASIRGIFFSIFAGVSKTGTWRIAYIVDRIVGKTRLFGMRNHFVAMGAAWFIRFWPRKNSTVTMI